MKYFFTIITIFALLFSTAPHLHAQTVNGQINSGTPTTKAINNSANTGYGSTGQINAATASDQKALNSCTAIQFTNLFNIALWVKCLIGVLVIPGIFTLAFLTFLWGVLKFMRSADQKDKQDSKQYIYMGLIGLFVMVGVWGIIKIINTTLGIQTVVPTLQTSSLNNNSNSSNSSSSTPAQPVSNSTYTTN